MTTKQHGPDRADLFCGSTKINLRESGRSRATDDEEHRRWDRDLAAEKEAWRVALERAERSSYWLLRRASELDGSTCH